VGKDVLWRGQGVPFPYQYWGTHAVGAGDGDGEFEGGGTAGVEGARAAELQEQQQMGQNDEGPSGQLPLGLFMAAQPGWGIHGRGTRESGNKDEEGRCRRGVALLKEIGEQVGGGDVRHFSALPILPGQRGEALSVMAAFRAALMRVRWVNGHSHAIGHWHDQGIRAPRAHGIAWAGRT
jgi:hypothetical protein